MRKAFRLGICSIVVLNAVFVFATGQRGDILFLDGKKHFIFTNPLSPFLDKNPEKLPESKIVSTSLWRGYVATWEVRNDRLVLIDVGMLRSDSDDLRSVMSEMFPNQKDVLADWYSGHVIIPNGKLLNYVHMGYASTYKKYILLRVEKGLVTRKWKAGATDFIKFRDAQFSAYKKTEEYREALEQTNKEGGDSKQNEEFLREFYSERYMSMIFDEPR